MKKKANIIMIRETWLKDEQQFKISGFKTFSENRDDGYGGVAILVKNNIFAKRIDVNINFEPIESIFVEITVYITPNANNTEVQTSFNALECITLKTLSLVVM